MKKYICFSICIFFLLISIVYASEFDITAKNVIMYNLKDNNIIYEQNADVKTQIASLTKIMTSIVAIENIDNLNHVITITSKDFENIEGYSKAGFKIGDRVTYLDLLYGTLLPSGAEAVNALVNNTLKDNFINEMNNTAKRIGLENTSFENAIGKDNENNYSTASDIAKLLQYALKNKTFKTIYTTKEYVATNGLNLKSTLMSYKNQFEIYEISGSKSGFTSKAGRCLSSIANLNGTDFMLVVINADKTYPYNAVKDSFTIYNYYKNNYSYQQIIDENKVIKQIPIKWGNEKNYNITSDENVEMFLKNNSSTNLEYKYDGINEIDYNYHKGDKLGSISVYNEGTLLYQSDVFLKNDIIFYQPIFFLIFGLLIFIVIIKAFFGKKKKRRGKHR